MRVVATLVGSLALTFGLVTSGTAAPGTTIVFANGVALTADAAKRDASFDMLELQDSLTAFMPTTAIPSEPLKFMLAFNPSSGLLLDLYESTVQLVLADAGAFWRAVANFDLMPLSVQQIALGLVQQADATFFVESPALQEHLAHYRMELGAGNRIVIVAHSQGNFYANEAFDLLVRPAETQSVGVVAVASPASVVSDHGPDLLGVVHTTLLGDPVIIAVALGDARLGLPLPLSPNTFGFGHFFVDAYLKGGESGPKILTQIARAMTELVRPPIGGGPHPGPNVGDVVAIPMLSGGVQGLAVEPSGLTVLAAERSGKLSRVELATGRVTPIAFISPGGIASPAIEPGGLTAVVVTAPLAGSGASGLKRVNLVTGQVTTIVERGIDHGAALVVEPGGRSALVTGSEGGLFRVNLETGAVTLLSGTGGLGLAIEPDGTHALVATGIFGAGTVSCDLVRVDLTTGSSTTVAQINCLRRPAGVTVEPGGATALVTTGKQFEGESGLIYRVDLQSGLVTLLTGCPGCSWPQIVLEPMGSTALFLGDNNESVIRLERDTLARSVLARSDSPVGISLGIGGTAAFTVSHEDSRFASKVSRVDLATGHIERIAFTGRASGGIVLDRSGTVAFITAADPRDIRVPTVQKIDLTSGTIQAISAIPSQGLGLALESSGSTALVAINDGRSLLRIDLGSGGLSVVSDLLESPQAVAIEQDSISALVGEGGSNPSLSRVNLLSGAVDRVVVGLSLVGVAVEPDGRHALVISGGAVIRVDLMTRTSTTLASDVCGRSNGLSGMIIEGAGDTVLLSHNVCGVLRLRVR